MTKHDEEKKTDLAVSLAAEIRAADRIKAAKHAVLEMKEREFSMTR